MDSHTLTASSHATKLYILRKYRKWSAEGRPAAAAVYELNTCHSVNRVTEVYTERTHTQTPKNKDDEEARRCHSRRYERPTPALEFNLDVIQLEGLIVFCLIRIQRNRS